MNNGTMENKELFTDFAANTITIEIPEPIVHRWPSCDKEAKDHHLFDYRKQLFDLDTLPKSPERDYRMKICRELIKDIGR